MEAIKRLERNLVWKGAWISAYRDTMEFANGNQAAWDFIHHNGAAAMVAEDEEGNIVMIRQWRPGADREILELPAGGINPGEKPEAAAIRELREETGMLCDSAEPLLVIQPSPAYNDETVFLFSCRITGKTDTEPDENEYLSTERYSLNALIAMIMDGTISDSKTIGGLFAYREYKRRERA